MQKNDFTAPLAQVFLEAAWRWQRGRRAATLGPVENAMLAKVRQTILERRLLARGERLLVGVSGGPDSVALLDALAALAPEFGWKPHVAHFNHLLRGADANADEAFVRELAAGHGLPFTAGRGDVRAFAAEQKLSIEDAARRLRHGFFQETAYALALAKLALGHTADDQVETLLQRLLRGTGTRGLAAIHASNRLGALTVVRPLLDVWKTELLDYLRQRGLKFRQDASNWDPQFQRNKIRHELIPALERDYNPALKTLLHQTAAMLAAEDEWLDTEAARALGSQKQLVVTRLLREHVAIQRRAVYRWLLENNVGAAVDFVTVETLRRMAASGRPARLTLTGGARVAHKGEALVLERMRSSDQWSVISNQSAETRLAVPGTTEALAFGIVVEVKTVTGKKLPKLDALRNHKSAIINHKSPQEWLDADVVGGALTLRCWRPGDRFQPIGMKAAKKLQDIFVDAKMPVAQRRRTPLLVAASGEICWLVGHRIGEKFKITATTRRALRIRIRAR
ncbi:MAG: tRNA lysidine(34) synthetase TilS [Verrucomicrobia bacterium]|nr:tRNA lysidine(34) synthetase TilS [Verrucomicrobiota bacterium]